MAKETKKVMIIKLFQKESLSIVMAILTLILAALSTCVTYLERINSNSNEEPDISTRLELITDSLSQDANELKSIETELNNRIAYVQDLKAEAELAESILDVSETQLNAIHSMIREELESNNERNVIPTILNNLFFCIVGMVVPPLFKKIYNKIKK